MQYEELLCSDNALEIFGAHGFIKRSLILKHSEGDYGIVFPKLLKAMRACKPVMNVYLKILKLVHLTHNQVRLKLKPGQLLILDNHKVLHGRTAFAQGKERLLYRTGYDTDKFFQP